MIEYPKRALILAAGVGRRLRPLTHAVPKGLIDIQGRALLRHQLEAWVRVGVESFVIVTGYKQSLLREAVQLLGGRLLPPRAPPAGKMYAHND